MEAILGTTAVTIGAGTTAATIGAGTTAGIGADTTVGVRGMEDIMEVMVAVIERGAPKEEKSVCEQNEGSARISYDIAKKATTTKTALR